MTGPALGFPHSSKVNGSRYAQMRERVAQTSRSSKSAALDLETAEKPQSFWKTKLCATAFDPLRAAILLIGGDKTGDARWYEKFVSIADRLYETHLDELRKEGKL